MVCAFHGWGWLRDSLRKEKAAWARFITLEDLCFGYKTQISFKTKEKSAFTCKLVGGPYKPVLESPELHLDENNLLWRGPTPPPPGNQRPSNPGAVPRGPGCCPERWLWHRPNENRSGFAEHCFHLISSGCFPSPGSASRPCGTVSAKMPPCSAAALFQSPC